MTIPLIALGILIVAIACACAVEKGSKDD